MRLVRLITLKPISMLLCASMVFNTSCATSTMKVSYLDGYASLPLEEIDMSEAGRRALIDKMKALKEKLGAYSAQLTVEEYDEIIRELTPIVQEYKKYQVVEQAISNDSTALYIPAQSKLTLTLDTYCLSPNAAAPDDDEAYVLSSEVPEIPLYTEIMRFTDAEERVSREVKQNLLWNLKNQVKFEDLPAEQQQFLLKIDPSAPLKLNNFIKEELKNQAGKLIDKYLPQVGQVKDVIEVVKGTAYRYEDYSQRVASMKSKQKKPDTSRPIQAQGYGSMATIVRPNGYSRATVTFINTSDAPQRIHSYFKPLRSDVQPLGFDVPDYYDFYGAVDTEYEALAQKILAVVNFFNRPGDFKTFKENPDRLRAIVIGLRDASLSEKRTIKEFGRSVDDDISNAFKHAYWNALMVRDIGVDFAKIVAVNHELNPGSKPEQTAMDMHNNRIGREIGSRLVERGITDADSIAQAILESQNDLKVLK